MRAEERNRKKYLKRKRNEKKILDEMIDNFVNNKSFGYIKIERD